MNWRIVLCLCWLGCGDDAMVADAGIDATIDAMRCARLGDPPDRAELRECGVCFESHATLLSSARSTAQLYAVEAGVLVSYQAPFHSVVLVSSAGVVVDTLSPYLDTVGLGETESRLEQVPGSQRVWAVSSVRGPGPDRSMDFTDLVLFEVSDASLEKLVALREPVRAGPSAALATGELIVAATDSSDTESLMVCSEIACREMDLSLGTTNMIWNGESNRAVVVTSDFGPLAGGRAWLSVIDTDGSLLSGPTPIHADPSAEYEPGEEPQLAPGVVTPYAIHKDGSSAVLLRGTLAGLDAYPNSHLFVRRVDRGGEFLDPPPGIWINTDNYPSAIDDALPNGRLQPAPRLRTLVAWPSLTPTISYLQLLDAAGAPLFSPPRTRDITARDVGFPAYIDGNDQAYMPGSTVTDNPDRSFQDDFNVDMVSEDLSLAWPTPVYYQECDRVDETPIAAIGAFDDGVWVAWEDVVIGEVDGLPYTLLKVARIMPDGDFGWRFEE